MQEPSAVQRHSNVKRPGLILFVNATAIAESIRASITNRNEGMHEGVSPYLERSTERGKLRAERADMASHARLTCLSSEARDRGGGAEEGQQAESRQAQRPAGPE